MKINPVRNSKINGAAKIIIMEYKVRQISKKVNPEIFRAYDIRGIYSSTINEEVAYLVGRAFVKFLNLVRKSLISKGVKKRKPKIVVGRDNRLSSPQLFRALTKGIIEEGGNVIDIGLTTSPMFYFAVAHFKYDGGIQITASHNPPQYNGFKLVREKAIPISEKTGLKEIQKLATRPGQVITRPGRIIKKEVLEEYLKFNLKDFDLKKIKPLKIVIDTANAVAGIVVPEFFKKTNCQVNYLFLKLDGSFPHHSPDPLIPRNLRWLIQEVKKKKADLGVAFDGDGDRIIFVDEKAKIISGDLITGLISEFILRERPREKILYDIRSSNIVRETIEKRGGLPVVSRIGHSLIKEKMRKEKIIFAGELSGHYYHRTHYFCECPFFILFKIIEKISETNKSFSQLISPFQKYYHSGEINFQVKNKKKVLRALEERFSRGKILKLDGLRIDFPDWWFNIRPSQTEPLLRLVIEAKTKKLMEKKKKELTFLIRKFKN